MTELSAGRLEEITELTAAAFWLVSTLVLLKAHRYRKTWDVGYIPWLYLPISFVSFSLHELTELTDSPASRVLQHLFGVWSAVFLLCTFGYLYYTLYLRKKPDYRRKYIPLLLGLVPAVLAAYLLYSGIGFDATGEILSRLENAVWLISGGIMAVHTYLVGTKSAGNFVRVYLFFQMAVYAAITWKVLSVLNVAAIALELFEIAFSVFATAAALTLERMLKGLSKRLE